MLSALAHTLVPVLARLRVTADDEAVVAPGSIIAANHTSLVDPGVVLVALRRLGIEPVILATAGLWKIPLLGRALAREGHIPVHRGTVRAADALDASRAVLAAGRTVLLYPEGGIPRRPDSGEREPGPFRTGLARLALATGAPVVPLGQAGARRVSSGPRLKQAAGLLTAPVRRPDLHVHLGRPLLLTGDLAQATEQARTAVRRAWHAAAHRGAVSGEPIA
ncbi:1-acyl-sn-glycerol-3-phosphate acyltransferase [Streptomyces sp. GC420]|uniref:lysophospholipid acyltransferase family protein n=1 Tax=Streptomyces sp. GC420 TaxID=2697568 RepID=UPI0014152626|nr:lysophospholipid acyltransferase family protein [Streptomyces sp. GC420]NBM17616.1 1-acyl-sn-glycerol-3-phosphate acyltransferase [Streptomyces sp. GC420]